MNRESLIKSVALMMLAALAGKVLLAIREPIVAAYFGASAQTDAYSVAMAIVAMLLSVSLSPVGSVLVPVYVERLHQDDVLARRFIRQVLAIYLLIVSSVLLVAYLAAPLLVRLYAPGFNAPTSELAERLTRILGLFAVCSGLAGYFGQVLTAHEGFLWVALGPVVTAAIVVVILTVAGPSPGIDVLAWGVVAGNAAQAFILGFSARRQAGGIGIDFKLGEAVQALAKLSGWMLIGRLVGQGNTLIDRNMLSFLSAGSIAALGFARSIYLLPFEIFVTGITRVIISDFSWSVATDDLERLRTSLSLSVRLAGFFMIPISLALAVLRVPIVSLLYQRGAFDNAAVQSTAAALLFLSLGLYFRALNFVGGRVFLARQRLFFPVVFSVFGLAVHLGLNLVLVPLWELAGVALSLTLIEIVNATLYYAKLRWDLGPLGGRQIGISLLKMGLAAAMMAASLAALNSALETYVSGLWASGLVLLVGGATGAAIYLGVLWLLRLEELGILFQAGRAVLSRLGWPVSGTHEHKSAKERLEL